MDYYSVVCKILRQISEVLSKESGNSVSLCPINRDISYFTERGFSIEIKEVDLPKDLISTPFPQYEDDKEGFYKVNRLFLGNTILDDTSKGFPFNNSEIKTIIKGAKKWAYYER